ncbi:MAG TPA: rRNA maturation RNase YbeY [Longimicrobium sp.]|jgi:probable rRNA maturation factor|uniref:rRNA maturation RNase YbeY n=1 Tax=Longimicrobium sp. TaxID=2029185 RepID=UPI002EDB5DCC
MDEIQVDVSVAEGVHPAAEPARIEAAVRHVLRAEGVAEAEISVALLDEDAIRQMNREWLDHDYVTDVISFHLNEEGEPPLGDVYLGVAQAARQAAELGADPAEELLRLAVHGTLHVLGWEHPEGADRAGSDMFVRQEALLREFLARGAG